MDKKDLPLLKMVCEPYICLDPKTTKATAGQIRWFHESDPYHESSVSIWKRYADFERETLRELDADIQTDSGDGFSEAFTLYCKKPRKLYYSSSLIGYSSNDYYQDSESNRLLRRMEFLREVCRKKGLAWLSQERCETHTFVSKDVCGCDHTMRKWCSEHAPFGYEYRNAMAAEDMNDTINKELDTLYSPNAGKAITAAPEHQCCGQCAICMKVMLGSKEGTAGIPTREEDMQWIQSALSVCKLDKIQEGMVTVQMLHLMDMIKECTAEHRTLREVLEELRNGGCGRHRNQNFNGQDQRNNCECCDVVLENIDEALSKTQPI